MMKTIAVLLLVLGASTAVYATPAPEINPASGMNALAFVAAGLMILRGRRK